VRRRVWTEDLVGGWRRSECEARRAWMCGQAEGGMVEDDWVCWRGLCGVKRHWRVEVVEETFGEWALVWEWKGEGMCKPAIFWLV